MHMNFPEYFDLLHPEIPTTRWQPNINISIWLKTHKGEAYQHFYDSRKSSLSLFATKPLLKRDTFSYLHYAIISCPNFHSKSEP